MTLDIDLSSKRALITGAGQGVGRGIASTLAAAGAEVAVNDVVAERAHAVVEEIRAGGGAAEAVPFDVSSWDDVHAAIAGFGSVDILVNNAGNAGVEGFAAEQPFTESDPADWARYVGVNLYGVMNCVHAVAPGMISAAEGRIITVISDAARAGDAYVAPYAAAKAGAAGFARSIAREFGRYGITSNCVSLGTVFTEAMTSLLDPASIDEGDRKRRLQKYIVRRFGEPADVANLVAYLASPMASWITGQTYPVNGGYTLTL